MTTPNIDLDRDSGNQFLEELQAIAQADVVGLKKAAESYGPSWKQRGGVGAFMMLARKWDRMEQRVKKLGARVYDIFHGIATDERGEGLIDDVRDLRRYLLLVEAEMVGRGFKGKAQRDNAQAAVDAAPLKMYPFTLKYLAPVPTSVRPATVLVSTGRPNRVLPLGISIDGVEQPTFQHEVGFAFDDARRKDAVDMLRLMADLIEKQG